MAEGSLVTHQKMQNYVRRVPHWEPPPPQNIYQNLLRVFPKGFKFTGVPGGGVPGKSSETDKYPDALRVPNPEGQGVYPGGGNPPQYALIPL